MTKNEIKSQYEEFDKVIYNFGVEVGSFASTVSSKTSSISALVYELGSKWEQNGYDDFKKNMLTKLASINNSLARCNEIQKDLSELSGLIAQELAKLREAD